MKAHRTTGAQTTEPGHHNSESVNDVRVLPVDEGVGVVEEDELSRAARRPRTEASGSPPRSTRSRRRDSQNCGHRAPRVGAWRTSFWEHLGSILCQKKCIKKCHRVNPERTTLHVSLSARRQRSAENPLPPATIPLTRYQNCSSIGSVRGLVNATLLQRIPKSTMVEQLGGPNTAELSQMLQNKVIIDSAGWQSPVVQASRAPWSACPAC